MWGVSDPQLPLLWSCCQRTEASEGLAESRLSLLENKSILVIMSGAKYFRKFRVQLQASPEASNKILELDLSLNSHSRLSAAARCCVREITLDLRPKH